MKSLDYPGLYEMNYDRLDLKVDSEEFQLACSDGEVYGEVVRGLLPFVYAKLGKELTYKSRKGDDKNTEYRIFRDCTAFFTDIQESLDKGDFKEKVSEIKIIIYC